MRLLKPGDPCPCCGKPLKEGLTEETLGLLSWLAAGLSMQLAVTELEEKKRAE